MKHKFRKTKQSFNQQQFPTQFKFFITISIPLFLHFFKHSFSSKPYLPFPSSFNSNFHLFSFLIVLVVYCYCCPILKNNTLLYQMNECDWYALFSHTSNKHIESKCCIHSNTFCSNYTHRMIYHSRIIFIICL